MNVKIEIGWKNELQKEFEKPYFETLTRFIREEYKTQVIYPPASSIFSAFNLCPFEDTKVVVLGQDPYHGPGQAHGLCFSVKDGIPVPPSLQNIFKEIQLDLGIEIPQSGNLERWAKQGVLLLNTVLTVRAHLATSHQKKGWEILTDEAISSLSKKKNDIVFLLWGKPAQEKEKLIDSSRHLILSSVHPSPLSASRGFFGNRHFSKTNEYLKQKGLKPIEW